MDIAKILDSESITPDIWSVAIWWWDEDYTDEDNPDGQENMISYPYFPSKCSQEEIEKLFRENFPEYLREHEKKVVDLTRIEVKHKGKHRWWLTWFAHETNQHFETEAAALADFDNWYYEAGLNRWVDFAPAGSGVNDDIIWCPMGAEDYWRRSACDCEKCRENGISRITH